MEAPFTDEIDKEVDTSPSSSEFSAEEAKALIDGLHQKRKSQIRWRWCYALTILTCLISTTISVCSLVMIYKFRLRTQPDTVTDLPKSSNPYHLDSTESAVADKFMAIDDCGMTVESAQAAGCHFDVMMGGWLHPQCYNSTMAAEAKLYTQTIMNYPGRQPGELLWYKDLDFKMPITEEDLPRYLGTLPADDMVVYTEEKWHVGHCLYMWQLGETAMTRNMEGKRDVWISEGATGIGHSNHCKELMMKPVDPEKEKRTKVPFQPFRCIALQQ